MFVPNKTIITPAGFDRLEEIEDLRVEIKRLSETKKEKDNYFIDNYLKTDINIYDAAIFNDYTVATYKANTELDADRIQKELPHVFNQCSTPEINTNLLKALHPEIYEQYRKVTKTRVFKVMV